jgi:hypothetical protein
MVAAAEALSPGAQSFRSLALKRPVALTKRDSRLLVDCEAAVRSLDSLSERRVIFGRGQAYLYKVQAGVVVAAQRPDWRVLLTPASLRFSGRVFESIDVVQELEFSCPLSSGYLRKMKLHNAGAYHMNLRIICLSDPAAAHFRDRVDQWGSLGVNAFNRESHVAMDEVSEPHPARVIGCAPAPVKLYMTTDRGRAAELLQAGDLPEATAGMTGHVLVLSMHEFELAPSESKEILFASLYSPRKLEEVLSDFGRLQSASSASGQEESQFECSSAHVAEAYAWARASLEGVQFGGDLLDLIESLRGLAYADSSALEAATERTKRLVLRDGTIGHPADGTKAGVLEASLFLSAISRRVSIAGDKKRARQLYPLMRRMAKALSARSKDGALRLDPGVPHGWRRLLGSGYPSGELAEVSLAASTALSDLARVSAILGKGEDSAKFRETSELIAHHVAKALVDDRGFLCPNIDSSGRLVHDETVDMAVACYRGNARSSVASSSVHRLLEKDFETDYGPRTVPTSNRVCFHSSYGQGQLGGYWTRAALAFSCLSYSAGLGGMGSLSLEKVSGLVTGDWPQLGGSPGEFPYWVDVEGKEAHGVGSDPVAASRFIQAVVEGELGLSCSASPPAFSPPALSTIRWALARDVCAGEKVSIFVGRAAGKAFAFASCKQARVEGGLRFADCARVDASPMFTHGASFIGPGQVVCVGNASHVPVKAHLVFAARSPGLSRRLSTPLEQFEPASRGWSKVGSLRVSSTMSLDVPLGPEDWKVFRVSDQ